MRCLFGGPVDWSDYTTYERGGKVVYVCRRHQPLTEKQIAKLEKKLDSGL